MTAFARVLAGLVLLAGLAPTASWAQSLGLSDRQAIRSIISDQMAAFQRDDGEAAYAFASPGIQRIFPSVEQFMTMVRQGYAPVYRPRAVAFGSILDTPRGPEQQVYVTGPDDNQWLAIYTLEQQPDGTWRISGCRLVKDAGPTI